MYEVTPEFIFSTDQSAMSKLIFSYQNQVHARVVVRLVNIFNLLAYDWMFKDESKVT
jgi:hypothetical protein